MPDPHDVRSDLRALLDAVESASPVDAVAVLAAELAAMLGADDVRFLIADFTGDALIRFLPTPDGLVTAAGETGSDHLATVPLAGSRYDDALRTQQVAVEYHGKSTRLYAPVTDRGDAMGVLELALPEPPDDDTIAFVASAAHALAYVVIANRRHTDLFERGQRDVAFSLAAEIQRRLLPAAFTCEGAEFTFAGWLEPASDAGGDTFDYTVERDILHVSISDAMGHTVHAAQLATLAVSSLRNSRRGRLSLSNQARLANDAVAEHGEEEDYVSALLLRIDLANGRMAAVNAGHPLPFLVRAGEVAKVPLRVNLPLGMMDEADYVEQALDLEPGDRLVLVTDGLLERNATSLDVAGALKDMTELHPREVVHAFARAVLETTGGQAAGRRHRRLHRLVRRPQR